MKNKNFSESAIEKHKPVTLFDGFTAQCYTSTDDVVKSYLSVMEIDRKGKEIKIFINPISSNVITNGFIKLYNYIAAELMLTTVEGDLPSTGFSRFKSIETEIDKTLSYLLGKTICMSCYVTICDTHGINMISRSFIRRKISTIRSKKFKTEVSEIIMRKRRMQLGLSPNDTRSDDKILEDIKHLVNLAMFN